MPIEVLFLTAMQAKEMTESSDAAFHAIVEGLKNKIHDAAFSGSAYVHFPGNMTNQMEERLIKFLELNGYRVTEMAGDPLTRIVYWGHVELKKK